MTNASRIYLGNNVKQVVVTGGTGNITLGTVLQHASVADEIPIGKAFHYVYRAVNGSPLECGIGVMVDATTHRRDTVYARVNSNVYETGDNLAKINMPVGAFLHTAPTKQMLDDILNEMSYKAYTWNGTDTEIDIAQRYKHISVEVGAALTTINFDPAFNPASETKFEMTLSAFAIDKVSGKYPRIAFAGATFQFGNGIPVPTYPVLTARETEVMPIGLVNGSTYTVGKLVKQLLWVRDLSGDTLVRNTNYTFDEATGVLTVLNVGSFEQAWSISYVTPVQTMFKFTSIDGGLTYLVENLTEHLVVNELADVTNEITLDVRHRTSIGNMVGASANVAITGLLPALTVGFPPAFFEFINAANIDKIVTIDTNVFDVASDDFFALQQIIVKPDYKLSFECIKNPDASSTKPYVLRNVFYRLFVNDMGVLPDPIVLDIRHPFNIGSLQGSTVDIDISGVSPDVPSEPMLKPAYFEFTNDSTVEKRIILDTDYFDIVNDRFTVVGFILLPPTYKLAFTVARNMDLSSGKNYSIRDLTYHKFTRDLGVLTSPITLDIRHPWNIGELTGGATSVVIDGVSPDVPLSPMLEPAHFTIVNNGTVAKTVSWDTALFSIAGSTLSQVTILAGYKLDFDVRRNPLNASVSYEVKVGDVNYNQTASGLSTPWNPSDAAAAIILSNSNKSVTRQPSGGANYSGVRSFGGKNSGKWRFALRCDAILVSGSGGSSSAAVQIGLASAGVSLSQNTGIAVAGGYQMLQYTSSVNAVLNNFYGVLVDFTLNKAWATINGSVVSGDPDAGTGGTDILDNQIFFPCVFMKTATTGGNAGLFTLMNEMEDTFAANWPTFQNWTA